MLSLDNRRIFLCCSRVDMRKGFAGLSGLVMSDFGADPNSGDAFVFIGKRGNMLKVLVWDRDGFWCCAKRLVKGTFRVPSLAGGADTACAITLSKSAWELLLAGIIVRDRQQLPRWNADDVVKTPQ